MPYAADSLIAKILGPCATMASIAAMGGDPNKWMLNFKQYEPSHYTYGKQQGTNYWANANYYDRAKIYFQWHVAEADNAAWLTKANELALNYRDAYAPNGDVSAHWSMPVGVALHAIKNNDATSKSWIMKVAENFSLPYYSDGIGNATRAEMDCRIQGRFLESQLLAYALSGGGATYATRLRKGLTDIISTQKPTGQRPWLDQQGGDKPFMDGILNDAMLLYIRLFEDDARIIPHIRTNVNWLWANMWLTATKTFTYNQGLPDEGPAADLNPLIIGGFIATAGWDARANDILAGGMAAWLSGDKQFNQSYTSQYISLAKRSGATSAWSGGDPVTPPVTPPAAIDVAGVKADLNVALAAIGKGQTALADATKAINAALAKLG